MCNNVENFKEKILKLKEKIKLEDIIIFFLPFIIFCLALLSYWPGIMTYDGNYQWNQIQTNYISDAHPFLSTVVPFLLSKIWNSKTVILILQIFVFSFIWSNICKNIRIEKNGNNEKTYKKQVKTQIIYTIIMSFFPIIFVYAITFWKDIIYSYSLMNMILLIYIGIKKNFKYSMFEMILWGANFIITAFYRHNGLIVTLILLPVMLYIFIKNKIEAKKIIAMFLSFVFVATMVIIPKEKIVQPSLDIMENKHMMTIFFTGSLLQAEVPMEQEDLDYLNTLIDVNIWKEIHTDFLINPVPHSKLLNKKRVEETFDDLLRICVKYSLKNPMVIVKHYLKADSLLWSPIPLGYVYIFDFSEWGPPSTRYYGFDAKVTSKFPIGKNICDFFVNITMKNKYIRNIIYRPATTMYATIIIMILLVKKIKNKKYYMLLLPMLLNTLSLIPVNLAQDLRYVYINYLTFFVVVLIYFVKLIEIKSNLCLLKEGKD